MKSIPCVSAVIAASLISSSALGQVIYTFSEQGAGSLQFGNFLVPLPGVSTTEPISGLVTLRYPLAAVGTVIAGDLVFLEPGSPAISDILRFSNEPGGAVYVFSDVSDGADSLADVINLQTLALQPNAVSVLEAGPESGPNGVTWVPTAGQPGLVQGLETYNFISDVSVPEPRAFGLLPLVTGFVVASGRFRRSSSHNCGAGRP